MLSKLLYSETQSEPEKVYIAGFRTNDTQAPPTNEATIQPLRHRQIITEKQRLALKSPLMQQWLRTKG